MTRKGHSRIRADIADAKPAASAAHKAGPANPPPRPPEYLIDRFDVNDSGVWLKKPDEKMLWVCAYLKAEAETEDEEGNFGMLWQWRDRKGRVREEVFSREQFSGEAGEMRSVMAARGLTLSANREAKQAFAEYINLAAATTTARVVYRTGWHVVAGKRIYVMGDNEVFGNPAERVILQPNSRAQNIFQQGGTLADWRASIGAACIGNSRLGLAVAMGFAPPLLLLAGEDNGGVNLYGNSRSGKTTCALASASVCGGDPAAGGARAAVGTWNGTSNSLEAVAAARSDIGFVQDELGAADARDVGQTQYMLSNGRGKTRLDRGAALRSTATFRVFYLSTGEVTLASKMAEAGIKMKAGQGMRLVDVPVDEGKGMGAFAYIHDAESVTAFVQSLRDAASRFFGTPFRTFIKKLVERNEQDSSFSEWLRDDLDRLTKAWLAPFASIDGQVRSVARRFALIALAGNLATDFQITGWGITESGEREAEWAARTCFLAWLNDRGTTDSHEEAQAVVLLRACVSAHQASRFAEWGEKVLVEGEQPDNVPDGSMPPPNPKFRTVNQLGWRRWIKPDAWAEGAEGQFHYFFTASGMKEALNGLDYKAALKTLVKRGLVIPGKAEIAQSIRVPGAGQQRLYQVPSSVMSATLSDLPASDD